MIDQPTAEEALKKLEPLLGEWALEATSPDGEPWPGEARASFEWHESGAHLVARSTIDLPERARTPSRSSAATRRTGPTSSSTPTTAASAASTR